MSYIVSKPASKWVSGSKTISASSTQVLFTFSLSKFRSIHFFISGDNITNLDSRMFRLDVLQESGGLKSIVSNKTGTLNFRVTENISGSNLEVSIVNSETFDIEVTYERLKIK